MRRAESPRCSSLYERLVTLPWDVPGSEGTYYLEQTSREIDVYAQQRGGDRTTSNSGRPDAVGPERGGAPRRRSVA